MVQGARLDLSSMDKRLQELFGDSWKDFYGDLSPQNLGPRYGTYGTFLPTKPTEPLVLMAAIGNDEANLDKRLQELFGDSRKDFYGELSAQILGARHGTYGTFLPTKLTEPLALMAEIKNNKANLYPVKPVLKKGTSKRPNELVFDSGRLQKRRKVEGAPLRENVSIMSGPRSHVKSRTESHVKGSHQIQTSTGSSCVLEGQENAYERSHLLLNEAREFKHRADRIMREDGQALSTTLYLDSMLKFLTVASLWEQRGETMKQAAMQLYADTAKLSQHIAVQAENQKNVSAAALAYKAVEIAHLRRAFLKSPALAGKDAVSLGYEATSAFEATQRYMQIMLSEELTSPLRACLNLSYFSLSKFLEHARQAI